MFVEWAVECSAEDPVLVVPWHDPGSKAAFVDLRANPYDFDAIPEAEAHLPLMQALRALNAARSPVFTAKCDAWILAKEELEQLQLDLNTGPAESRAGFASYIDVVLHERSRFASFHKHEDFMRKLARQATTIDHPHAALDCVLRPALLDFEGPQEGYAISIYVKALGSDEHEANRDWGDALANVVAVLRSKEFSR